MSNESLAYEDLRKTVQQEVQRSIDAEIAKRVAVFGDKVPLDFEKIEEAKKELVTACVDFALATIKKRDLALKTLEKELNDTMHSFGFTDTNVKLELTHTVSLRHPKTNSFER